MRSTMFACSFGSRARSSSAPNVLAISKSTRTRARAQRARMGNSKQKNGPYRLKIDRLDYLSREKRPAQGEGGRVALLKHAKDDSIEVQLSAHVSKTYD